MKKSLLFLVFGCLLIAITNAQTPFAKPGAHWCVARMSYSSTTYGEPIKSVNTIKQGINCSAIPGVGCLFVQNDTVYRIIQDSSIHFLYDYSAHAGDVWNIYLTPQELQTATNNNVRVHIDSVYTLNINGQNLRNFETSITDTPFASYGYTLGLVTETIGNQFYFLPGPWGLVDFNVPSLDCFQDSAIGAVGKWWQNFPPLDSCVCHTWMGIEDISSATSFSLSPNPATNSVTITVENPERVSNPFGVTITDITGRRVAAVALSAVNSQWSTANFVNGIYFVTVGTITKKLIITK